MAIFRNWISLLIILLVATGRSFGIASLDQSFVAENTNKNFVWQNDKQLLSQHDYIITHDQNVSFEIQNEFYEEEIEEDENENPNKFPPLDFHSGITPYYINYSNLYPTSCLTIHIRVPRHSKSNNLFSSVPLHLKHLALLI